MTQNRVGIINYGLGNIQSLSNALHFIGMDSLIISEPNQISECSHLILPGVGSFKVAMHALDQNNLTSPLLDALNSGTPTLAICLGMQLLFQRSVEGGITNGLGFVPGEVSQLKVGNETKVPHTQWNRLYYHGNCKISKQILENPLYYFTHSYAIYDAPHSKLDEFSLTEYGGSKFLSYAKVDNVMMCQFHPENSRENGLKLLKIFAGA